MRYRETAVPPDLCAFVALLWSLESEPGEIECVTERILPDGVAELVLHFGVPFEQRFAGGVFADQPDAFVVTLARRPLEIRPSCPTTSGFVAVRFWPGGFAHFVGAPQRELSDRSVALAELFGRDLHAVKEALVTARDPARRFARVIAFLRAQLGGHRRDDIAPVIRRIVAARGQIVVRSLAADLGCSERRLQRVFLDQVGSSPKQYARLVRFHAACRLIRTTTQSFAEIAAECGYFDQAHLVHDVREHADETPTQLRERAGVVHP